MMNKSNVKLDKLAWYLQTLIWLWQGHSSNEACKPEALAEPRISSKLRSRCGKAIRGAKHVSLKL